ncbi:hypothetical protein LZ31DRAFT_345384 [Colletotrichum somersetense]|nr:hypothetical protein LZ31DRAFT_345384 [Colletotrichum somersetense]
MALFEFPMQEKNGGKPCADPSYARRVWKEKMTSTEIRERERERQGDETTSAGHFCDVAISKSFDHPNLSLSTRRALGVTLAGRTRREGEGRARNALRRRRSANPACGRTYADTTHIVRRARCSVYTMSMVDSAIIIRPQNKARFPTASVISSRVSTRRGPNQLTPLGPVSF